MFLLINYVLTIHLISLIPYAVVIIGLICNILINV